MGFDDVLAAACAALAKEAEAGPIAVTDAEFKEAALKMARVGYDLGRTKNSDRALLAYLMGGQLILAGPSGTGKTSFFKALCGSGLAHHRIVVYSLMEHGAEYTNSIVDDIRGHDGDEVVVDDVGCESSWGGRRNDDILSRIIAVREASPSRTHFTTNLGRDGRNGLARYDERVRSRLRQCAFVPMVGRDNRTATANAKETELCTVCAMRESWLLCKDWCANCRGDGCSAGVKVPPDLKWGDRRRFPPQECPHFVPRVAADGGVAT